MTEEDDKHTPDAELAKTLWTDEPGSRRFLIPDDLELPTGELNLRTATGRERRADPAALAPFEVSAEEAQAWAKAQLGEVGRRLKEGLKGGLFGASKGDPGETRDSDRGRAGPQQSATPGMDLLADITGTPRERLDGDYRAVGRALREYLQDMSGTAVDAVSGEPDREQAARRRMRGWAKTLRAHGIAAPDVERSSTPSEDAAQQRSQPADPDGVATRKPPDDPDDQP